MQKPVLYLLLAAAPLAAQEPRAVLEGAYEHFPTRLEVKLADGSEALLTPEGLVSPSGHEIRRTAALFARADAEPLIRLPRATLDRWHAETPGAAVGHLGQWFRLTAKDAAAASRLLADLRDDPLVETAYFEPVPELPQAKNNDIAPPTPDFRTRQGYLGIPPSGIHASWARPILGARGQTIQIVDMEHFWNLDHEDISQLTLKAFLHPPILGSGNHGTAVAGEIVSDRNRYGTTGITDLATLRVSSWDNGGVTNAIAVAANGSKTGDIVLLEVHYRTSLGYVPAEYFSSNYNVIKSATARGIHVVEAAGNGNNDLDDQGRFGRLFDLTYRDSGAIMVGATNGAQTTRAGFSNYGGRITANGWGYSVTTTGYGTIFNPGGDKRQQYTDGFSGTSSASPIVTGAIAALAGAVEFQNERILGTNEVRQLLLAHGTPCSGKIQNRPDLKAMLQAVGLPDGLLALSERVSPGGTVDLDLEDTKGRFALLLVSDTVHKTDLGLNRQLHLDLARLFPLEVFATAGKPQLVRVPLPNDKRLVDTNLYFQYVSTDATLQALKVSSSTEVWVE